MVYCAADGAKRVAAWQPMGVAAYDAPSSLGVSVRSPGVCLWRALDRSRSMLCTASVGRHVSVVVVLHSQESLFFFSCSFDNVLCLVSTDKMADQISDAVLDAFLAVDPRAKVPHNALGLEVSGMGD